MSENLMRGISMAKQRQSEILELGKKPEILDKKTKKVLDAL